MAPLSDLASATLEGLLWPSRRASKRSELDDQFDSNVRDKERQRRRRFFKTSKEQIRAVRPKKGSGSSTLHASSSTKVTKPVSLASSSSKKSKSKAAFQSQKAAIATLAAINTDQSALATSSGGAKFSTVAAAFADTTGLQMPTKTPDPAIAVTAAAHAAFNSVLANAVESSSNSASRLEPSIIVAGAVAVATEAQSIQQKANASGNTAQIQATETVVNTASNIAESEAAITVQSWSTITPTILAAPLAGQTAIVSFATASSSSLTGVGDRTNAIATPSSLAQANSAMAASRTMGLSSKAVFGSSAAKAVATTPIQGTSSGTGADVVSTSTLSSVTSSIPAWPASTQSTGSEMSNSKHKLWPIVFPIVLALGLLVAFFVWRRRKATRKAQTSLDANGSRHNDKWNCYSNKAGVESQMQTGRIYLHNNGAHLGSVESHDEISEKEYWDTESYKEDMLIPAPSPVYGRNQIKQARVDTIQGNVPHGEYADETYYSAPFAQSSGAYPEDRDRPPIAGAEEINDDESAPSHMPAMKSQAILHKIGNFWTRPASTINDAGNRISADSYSESGFSDLERNRRTSLLRSSRPVSQYNAPVINVHDASPTLSSYSQSELGHVAAVAASPGMVFEKEAETHGLSANQNDQVKQASGPAEGDGQRKPMPLAVARLRALSPVLRTPQNVDESSRRPSVDSDSHLSQSDMGHSIVSESFSLFSAVSQNGLAAAPAPPRRPSRELPVAPSGFRGGLNPMAAQSERRTHLQDLSRQIAASPNLEYIIPNLLNTHGTRSISQIVQPVTQPVVIPPSSGRTVSAGAAPSGRTHTENDQDPHEITHGGLPKNFHLGRIAGSLAMRRDSSAMSCESFGNLDVLDFPTVPNRVNRLSDPEISVRRDIPKDY